MIQVSKQFQTFWDAYPRRPDGIRPGKSKAWQYWKRDKLDNELDRILEALKILRKSPDWRDLKYIPHAQTFLNQRRYEDVEDKREPVNPQMLTLTQKTFKPTYEQDEVTKAREGFARLTKEEKEPYLKRVIKELIKLPRRPTAGMIERYAAENWYKQRGG